MAHVNSDVSIGVQKGRTPDTRPDARSEATVKVDPSRNASNNELTVQAPRRGSIVGEAMSSAALDAMAANDLGRLASPRIQASPQAAPQIQAAPQPQASPRIQAAPAPRAQAAPTAQAAMPAEAPAPAPAAGQAPQPAQAGSRRTAVPVVPVRTGTTGDIPYAEIPDSGLGTMSSHHPRFDDATRMSIHEDLAESGAQLEAARILSRGAATPAVPSRAAENASERGAASRMAVESDAASEELKRPLSFIEKASQPIHGNPSRKRPSSITKMIRNRFANMFREPGRGYRIWGKVNGLTSLDLREVGVGFGEIMAVVDQSPEMLDRLLAANTGLEESVASWSANEIADFINSHNVYVGTFKEPSNTRADMQRRKLRVLTSQQRGIYLHPIMAPMYNADMDGDDMEVSLDPDVAKLTSDPMENMIGVDGKMTLNADFLTPAEIVDGYAEGKTARDYVRDVIFGQLRLDGRLDGRTVSPLVDAVLELSRTAKLDGDAQTAAWGKVFRAARSVADSLRSGRAASNDLMAELCKSVYDGMHALRLQGALTSIDADILEVAPDPRTYDDQAIYAIMRDMVAGEVPNNFQDLKVLLNGFIGNVSGKNAPFRFTADVGKMLKMDSRLQIGDGTFIVDPANADQMRMFFESTVKYAESNRMAVEVKKAGRSQYYAEAMRSRVIRDIGFPEAYGSYSDFLSAFVRSYNRNSAIINEANLVFQSNMGIASNSNRGLVSPLRPGPGGVSLGDLAEPLLSIYGSYSVERMFPAVRSFGTDRYWSGNPNAPKSSQKHPIEREFNYFGTARFWITGKYRSFNLRQFSHENRLLTGDKVSDSIRMDDIRNRLVSKTAGMPDQMLQAEMLFAIADKRTGSASKFNEKVYGKERKRKDKSTYIDYEGTTVQTMAELLTELKRLDTDGTVAGRRDQQLWIDDVASVLIESGPEMFVHFGMDSPAGFLESDWARKMIEHRGDPEVLGGIRTAMVFEYRMERIDALSELPDPNADIDRYMDAYNNLQFAIDELSASSEVWSGIIKEFQAEETEGMESVFHAMASGRIPIHEGPNGRYEWKIGNEAGSFWANPGDHSSLRSVIEDPDLDRQTKWKVITDVVRYWEHDAYLKWYEVGYQLEFGKDSSYSVGSSDMSSVLGVYSDFQSAFNRWGAKGQAYLQDNIDQAYGKWGDKPGTLMGTLKRLDENPHELIMIDDLMYADSIASVLDKTYAQTEKASQHPWTNAVYSGLSFQRNGGFMHDVTRTDDRLLGIQSARSIDVHDIVHILADPEASITVYNDYGEYAVLSRKILLDNALGRETSGTEDEIWEFLRQEPRVAAAIRRHSACVAADTDGKGFVGAMLGTSETIELCDGSPIDPLGKVKYLMRDHPVYAGMIALANPAFGTVSRNMRRRYAATERYLSSCIYRYASSDADSIDAANAILEDIGITDDALRESMRSGYDSFCERLGLPVVNDSAIPGGDGRSMSDDDADYTYYVVMSYLARYIEEVRREVPLGMNVARNPAKPDGLGVDVSSAASFWDVLQELGGAKTNVSTGVEGSETFQYAEWLTHISVHDGYADLESVEDDIDASWDNAWTNLSGSDGTPLAVHVGEDGRIANLGELLQAKADQGVDEIVVEVPAGYMVPDLSTDSHGNPVPSLSVFMVSKRSNGAEAFNLKAKKAGLDGTDSITKMQGKRRQVEGERGELRDADFIEIQHQLRRVAAESPGDGLKAAKAELASMMLEENRKLGYDDLSLSNYMCIADMMLIQGDDGEIYLRSLEMLVSAVKHRIGPVVQEMDDAEIRTAADAIVNDAGEDGVGIATMNPLDALDGVRPHGKAGSSSGIRPASSVFARNYDLLETIAEKAAADGIDPIDPVTAERRNDRIRHVEGIEAVVRRSSVVRNYNIVGFAGAYGTAAEPFLAIGPSNAIVIGDGMVSDADVADICMRAYGLGMTVIVSSGHRDAIPSDMIRDAMPCSGAGDVIIPCFDMRLNGAEAKPYNGGRLAIFQAPFSRYVISAEDSLNHYQLGDAQGRATKALPDRMHIVESGSTKVTAESLFPNVFRNPDFSHCSFSVSLASGREIAMYIANGVRCSIDYGVVEGGNGFEQRQHDVDAAIERYRQRYAEADPDGIIRGGMSECEPGDIVAWAEIEILDNYTGKAQYAFAPIIPFQLSGSKRAPGKFMVEQIAKVDNDSTVFSVDWYNTSDVSESYGKYFDSSGGANKGMIDFSDPIQETLVLRDGTPIDVFIAKASTDSRKIGTDRRVKTMISLMALARMHGYNFAKADGSFPEDPELKERLLHKRQPTSFWRAQLDGIVFSVDPQVDAFLHYECRKVIANGGNPSDYLANLYTDANGVERNTHVMWEFEAMFDQGLTYEDGLLRFLHSMDRGLCPDGIYDLSDGPDERSRYLFRLARSGDGPASGYDNGVLQMQVPHTMPDGRISYVWDNVYIGMSFFGEDFSGFSRPNIDGASNFLDAMNTGTYHGVQLDEHSSYVRAMWASSDLAHIAKDGGAIGTPDRRYGMRMEER